MMSSSEQIVRTAAHIRNHWDPAVFTPAVGDPVSLKVHPGTEIDFQPGGLEAQAAGSAKTIEYFLSDIGREANEGEFFTMDADGTVYTVADVEANDGIFVTVNVI